MVFGLAGENIYEYYLSTTPSRHMTFIFNLFVWCTIFNLINARMINDELNTFKGFFNNASFLVIFLIITIGQFIIC
jgi:Ca2+-transporting ATPase